MAKASFQELVEVMHRLRSGCPWDKEQTWDSLRQYILEEAYEVVDAIENGTPAKVMDEAGDLLFQVVFLAEIAQENGWWEAADAVGNIKDKLVSRHPHVFPQAHASHADGTLPVDAKGGVKTSDDVMLNWEAIKAKERAQGGATSALDGVPVGLPALVRALKLGKRAARTGFDWRSADAVLDKIGEELAEVRAALAEGDTAAAGRELGDLFFAAAQAARFLDVNPEDSARGAVAKFEARFRHLETALAAEGKTPKDLDDAALDRLWEQAKRALDADRSGKKGGA